MNKPTIEQLHHSGEYDLVEALHVDDMSKFLMREMGIKQPKAFFFAHHRLHWRLHFDSLLLQKQTPNPLHVRRHRKRKNVLFF